MPSDLIYAPRDQLSLEGLTANVAWLEKETREQEMTYHRSKRRRDRLAGADAPEAKREHASPRKSLRDEWRLPMRVAIVFFPQASHAEAARRACSVQGRI